MAGFATQLLVVWMLTNTHQHVSKLLDDLAVQEAATKAPDGRLNHRVAASTGTLRQLADEKRIIMGAATEPLPLLHEPDYASLMANQFSMLATENRLKFDIVHPEPDRYNFEPAEVIVRFAEANGMSVRGHCIVWHNNMPRWLRPGMTSEAEAEAALVEHTKSVMQRFSGRIIDWDVVNEPIADEGGLRDTPWKQMLGDNYVARAFRIAREADPKARLFLNDFGCETICPKSDTFYEMVKQLQNDGVPIDGVGFQMHLNLAAGLSTESLRLNLERFSKLGLELQITEMDVSLDGLRVTTETLRQQAQMYEDVLRVALSFPEVKKVIFWGGSDRHSWLKQHAPLLFDEELKAKPALNGVVRALTTLHW